MVHRTYKWYVHPRSGEPYGTDIEPSEFQYPFVLQGNKIIVHEWWVQLLNGQRYAWTGDPDRLGFPYTQQGRTIFEVNAGDFGFDD